MAPLIKQAPISCSGHTRPVVDISYSAETDCGNLFITAAKDGRAMLRRGDTGDWIGTFLGHQGAVWSCVLDAHGTKAATGAADFTAKIWDTGTGAPLLSITEDHIVRCVDMSRTDSGAYLLTATNRKKLAVYDLIAPTTPIWSVQAHDQFIRRALWCDGDRHIVTVSEDATIKLWDLKDHKSGPVLTTNTPLTPLHTRRFDHPLLDLQFRRPFADQTALTTLAFSCGPYVMMQSVDWRNPAAVMSNGDGEPEPCFKLPCSINSVSLHPDRDVLVCAGEDHYIYRLDSITGTVLETCKGHFGPVHCVRFSPDGNMFTSGSEDGTVRMWQTDVGRDFGLWYRSSTVPSGPLQVAPDAVADGDHNVMVNGAPSPINDIIESPTLID